MDILKLFIQVLAAILSFLAALLSATFFIRFHWPAPVLWFLKLYVSALSPFILLIGFLSALVGLTTSSPFISLIGTYVSVIFFLHILRITSPPDPSTNFEQAFGLQWEEGINSEQKKQFLQSRRIVMLPPAPKPRMEQNIVFATIPDTGRNLLCDVWKPPENVIPSGLAFIYLHGSAWYFLDKDLGTRPFFSHLAAQGHLIIDVAHRLFPESDMMGMVNDVKRAISWMKENAGIYGINPNRIVVGGGSAGAHLALLAAFTVKNLQFTPKDLEGKDLTVSAVISMYGPADLEEMYYHTNQHLTTRSTPGKPKKSVPTKMSGWIIKAMGDDYHRLGMDKGFENAGTFSLLLGGHPDECREQYTLFSPITHVHPECPPTLLIHGEHDIMAPIISTRLLHTRLKAEKVKTVMHILPQTEHAFDLQLPKISPSAHSAIYDVERFLALF